MNASGIYRGDMAVLYSYSRKTKLAKRIGKSPVTG